MPREPPVTRAVRNCKRRTVISVSLVGTVRRNRFGVRDRQECADLGDGAGCSALRPMSRIGSIWQPARDCSLVGSPCCESCAISGPKAGLPPDPRALWIAARVGISETIKHVGMHRMLRTGAMQESLDQQREQPRDRAIGGHLVHRRSGLRGHIRSRRTSIIDKLRDPVAIIGDDHHQPGRSVMPWFGAAALTRSTSSGVGIGGFSFGSRRRPASARKLSKTLGVQSRR